MKKEKIITSLILDKIIFTKYFIIFLLIICIYYRKKKKRIGVVGLKNHNNIGNNLVKFAIYTKLKELGFEPIIIGYSYKTQNIYFLKKYVKLKEIKKTFLELREEDYDILMVNSDQTWNGKASNPTRLLHYGYLKFAENWTIPKFVYGASLGVNHWKFSKSFEIIARNLLKKFSGVSVREKNSIDIIKKHLGIEPEFVLDPTLIIDKKIYLDLIKNFKTKFNFKEQHICIYQLDGNILIKNLIKEASRRFNYKIYKVNRFKDKYIENFIFCINNRTIFSIIFKKPFISYLNTKRGSGRFLSLIDTFNLTKRIIFPKDFKKVNINLLKTPLYINETLLNYLKNYSINFLKKNLNINN